MQLLYQTHSPFARKALVFAHEVGLADCLEVIPHETSPTLRNPEVFRFNPLGKVPVLLRSDGPPLFESDVICAYLDTLHTGRPLIPQDDERRWRALLVQAVAQGVAEAGIALRWETVRRPAPLRYPRLAAGHTDKLIASYDWLERELNVDGDLDVGHIAAATALEWIAFRDLPGFREGRPRLSAWLDSFARRPSMQCSSMHGDTHD